MFPEIKAGGWGLQEPLTSAQMNLLNSLLPKAIDGEGGGTYTLVAPLVLNGEVRAERIRAERIRASRVLNPSNLTNFVSSASLLGQIGSNPIPFTETGANYVDGGGKGDQNALVQNDSFMVACNGRNDLFVSWDAGNTWRAFGTFGDDLFFTDRDEPAFVKCGVRGEMLGWLNNDSGTTVRHWWGLTDSSSLSGNVALTNMDEVVIPRRCGQANWMHGDINFSAPRWYVVGRASNNNQIAVDYQDLPFSGTNDTFQNMALIPKLGPGSTSEDPTDLQFGPGPNGNAHAVMCGYSHGYYFSDVTTTSWTTVDVSSFPGFNLVSRIIAAGFMKELNRWAFIPWLIGPGGDHGGDPILTCSPENLGSTDPNDYEIINLTQSQPDAYSGTSSRQTFAGTAQLRATSLGGGVTWTGNAVYFVQTIPNGNADQHVIHCSMDMRDWYAIPLAPSQVSFGEVQAPYAAVGSHLNIPYIIVGQRDTGNARWSTLLKGQSIGSPPRTWSE